MRCILNIVVLCCLVVFCSNLYSEDYPGLEFVSILSGTAWEVKASADPIQVAEIVIPSTYNDLPVLRIAQNGFRNNDHTTSVVISEGVTTMLTDSFSQLRALTSLTIPLSMTTVNDYAVRMNNNVTIYAKSQGALQAWGTQWNQDNRPVYWGHENGGIPGLEFRFILEGTAYEVRSSTVARAELTIPTMQNDIPVLRIAQNGFRNNQNIVSVVISEGVTTMLPDSFSQNQSMTSLTIPLSMTTLSDFAVRMNNNLTIYARSQGALSAWGTQWNQDNRPVYWGHENGGIPGLEFRFILGDTAYEVRSSTVSREIINIPAIQNGVPVLRVAQNGFRANNDIVRVNIEDGITTILVDSFSQMSRLEYLFIPLTVIDIRSFAIRSVNNLTIHTDHPSRPAGWDNNWNPDNRPVVWGEVSEDDETIGVYVTGLRGNFPNPFNPSTTISFQLSVFGYQYVEIDVFNIRGQLVKTLMNDYLTAGNHSVAWDGRDDNGNYVSSGMYLYRMTAGEHQSTKRMLLMK